MFKLIDTVLHAAKHEEQAYNSCNGILHCCDGISKVIAEEASKKCVEFNACQYSYFKRVLTDMLNNKSPGNENYLNTKISEERTFTDEYCKQYM